MRGFTKSKNKQILKVTALYVMWNPEICQDPSTCCQDDLVLYSLQVDLFRYNQHPKVCVIFVRRTKKAPKNPWLFFFQKIWLNSGVDDTIFHKIDYKMWFCLGKPDLFVHIYTRFLSIYYSYILKKSWNILLTSNFAQKSISVLFSK